MTQNEPKNNSFLFIMLAVAQSALWGAGAVATKFAFRYVGPFWCLAIRFGVAALLFFVFFNRRIRDNARRLKVGPLLLVGLATVGTYGFAYQSLAMSDATTVGFLMAIPVVFLPLIAHVIQKTPVDLKILPVIAVVTVGMYLLCGGGQFSVGWAELFAVLSSLCYAFTLVFSAQFLDHTEPLTLSFFQCLIMAVFFLAAALLFEPMPVWTAFTPGAVWNLLFLAVGSSFLCFLFQNLILLHLSSTLMSLILCSESVFTALFAGLLLYERLDTVGYVGAALITAGVVVATWLSRERRPPPAETVEQ